MYFLQCFDKNGQRLQVSAGTSIDAFNLASQEGAIRAIDPNGWVYLRENEHWVFGGTGTWTQVAGERAGSQNFSLINPPK